LRVLVALRRKGLSLQKVRIGIENLASILPDVEPLTRLIIYTDGADMIVAEKGNYFSAITRQRYICFDTEQISTELVTLQEHSNATLAADEFSRSKAAESLHSG